MLKQMKNKREKKEHIAFDPKEYYRLGLNIETIRKAHNESQLDLALSIGVSKSAISNYETGQRIPQRDELNAISKHYNIPVSRLMYGDFSNYSIANDVSVTDSDTMRLVCDMMLPFICPDEAMENKHFKKAMELHIEMGEAIFSGGELPASFAKNLEKCEKLYKKAIEDGFYDACVNLLWWSFYFSIGISEMRTTPAEFEDLISKDTTVGGLGKILMPSVDDEPDKEWESEKKQLIKDYRQDIINNLYYLKNSGDPALSVIADYYFALGYIFNIINPELSSSESRMVGHEMMAVCHIMNNPYAKDFISMRDLFE